MDCPYCLEEIKDEAVVCKHCHRDLFIARPLLDRIEELTAKVKEFEEQVADGRLVPIDEIPQQLTEETADAPPRRGPIPAMSPTAALALTFISLLIAHFLIIIVYDASLIWLRIVSIAVPLAFGFLYKEQPRGYLLVAFLAGMGVAVISILAMSTVVSRVDKVPVLPEDLQGWREFVEYGASIAFGFFTGVLFRRALLNFLAPRKRPSKLMKLATDYISRKLGAGKGGKDKEGLTPEKLEGMLTSAIGAGSALISAVTGLRQFFGV